MIVQIKIVNQKVIGFFQRFEIKEQKLGLIFSLLIFAFCLNWFYSYVGVYDYLHVRPSSIHSSAQCQRASIALNYYETDMNFFKPRIQKYSEMGGVTGVEFPVMYYLDALAYKLLGFSEVNARIISLSLVSLGLLFFFLLTNQFLKNSFLSITIVGSAAFSPTLLFYAPNFMPDAPSLALILIAWFYFFKYIRSHSIKHFNFFLIFATLAALIKVVALIALVIIVCLMVLDGLKFFKKNNSLPVFEKPHLQLIKIAVSVGVVFSWYYYANWLATAYKNETFSLSPVMGDAGTLKAVMDNVKELWLFHYYANETYVLLGAAIVFICIFAKYTNRLLFSITFLYFLGNLTFVYFFLNQFINHDYYIISILPLVFFLLLTFADSLVRVANTHFVLIKGIFFIIIAFNMKESLLNCKENYQYRYSSEIYYWAGDNRPYFDLESRLRAVGVKRTDLTISGFDDTFCSSLYLMNQIGIPIASWNDSLKIDEMIKYKLSKYLILNDTARFNKIYPNDFSKNIILTHRGLVVYKLR